MYSMCCLKMKNKSCFVLLVKWCLCRQKVIDTLYKTTSSLDVDELDPLTSQPASPEAHEPQIKAPGEIPSITEQLLLSGRKHGDYL